VSASTGTARIASASATAIHAGRRCTWNNSRAFGVTGGQSGITGPQGAVTGGQHRLSQTTVPTGKPYGGLVEHSSRVTRHPRGQQDGCPVDKRLRPTGPKASPHSLVEQRQRPRKITCLRRNETTVMHAGSRTFMLTE
jgi:hypothetical protein